MDYKEKYEQALERMKSWVKGEHPEYFSEAQKAAEFIFPELKESENEKNEKIRVNLIKAFNTIGKLKWGGLNVQDVLTWLEKQGEPEDKGEISDGYHTFNELYRYRMLYNAAFFNLLPKELVHKSKRHHDGEECFGGGWFIVMANLPTGQISNHYELKDWDLFQIPERDVADEWDGHTPQEAADRLHKYLLGEQGEKKKSEDNKSKFEVGDWIIATGEVVYQIKDIQDTNVTLVETNGDESIFDISVLDDAKPWTIKNAKDGDVLTTPAGAFIYNGNSGGGSCPGSYCGINTLGKFQTGTEHHWTGKKVYPATKEQRELLFRNMKEEGYEWNADKKELKKIEQKSVDKTEPKFKVGDWIVQENIGIYRVIEVCESWYEVVDNKDEHYSISFNKEYMCHLWSINDAKNGDVLVENSCIFIIQKLGDNSTAAKTYCTLHIDGDFDDGSILYFDIDSTKPATKEQCDTLFAKMKELGYEWNNEKKELKKIKPKFKVGDFVVNDYCRGKIIELTNDAYLLDTEQGMPFSCEHNIHLWTIQDAEDGDVLVDEDNNIGLYLGEKDDVYWHSCIYLGCDGYLHGGSRIEGYHFNKNTKPATKEQCYLLFQKMKEAGYEWDADKKELKKIEVVTVSKEDEDEKIRKDLTEFIKSASGGFLNSTIPCKTFGEWLEWIEKQGEQKSVDKTEPKFKAGDWIVFNGLILHIDEVVNGYYRTTSRGDGIHNSYDWDIDNAARLWTIQEAKDGDVLAYVTDEEDLWIMIYRSLYEPYEGHVHYHALLVNDNFSDKGTCFICIDNLKPATKEQRELLFQKMKEEGYEWDSEKKELKKIEDEEVRKALISILKSDFEKDTTIFGISVEQIIAWLEKQRDYNRLIEKIKECKELLSKEKEKATSANDKLSLGGRIAMLQELLAFNICNTTDKVEPKFKVGDWIACKELNTARIINIEGDRYEVEFIDGSKGFPHIEWVDRNLHLWTIQDAKDGDMLANDHHILILKESVYDWYTNGTPYSVKAYCGIKPNGNFEIGKDNWSFCGTLHIHPATKEQRDTFFAKMVDAGYKWDSEKKELKTIKTKTLDADDILPYLGNNQVQDILEDMGMLDDNGHCPHTAEEIFKAGMEHAFNLNREIASSVKVK